MANTVKTISVTFDFLDAEGNNLADFHFNVDNFDLALNKGDLFRYSDGGIAYKGLVDVIFHDLSHQGNEVLRSIHIVMKNSSEA